MVISPHVTIYKFPITAISSILNRGTGLLMSGNFVLIGNYYIFSGLGLIKSYERQYDNRIRTIENSVCYIAESCLVYHTLAGIRHLIWDNNPTLLSNKKVMNSSKFILFSTALYSFMRPFFPTPHPYIQDNTQNYCQHEEDIETLIEVDLVVTDE